MHPHLHTKDNKNCEDVMNALEECHAKGFLWKVVGGCSDAKHKVNMCLRAERLKKTAHNREEAKKDRQRIQSLFEDVDKNS